MWEWAQGRRLAELRRAPNAEIKHRRGQIASILIHDNASEFEMRSRHGNPQKDVHRAETDTNPPRVFAFKRHCSVQEKGEAA